jgi:hypothetical protein
MHHRSSFTSRVMALERGVDSDAVASPDVYNIAIVDS